MMRIDLLNIRDASFVISRSNLLVDLFGVDVFVEAVEAHLLAASRREPHQPHRAAASRIDKNPSRSEPQRAASMSIDNFNKNPSRSTPQRSAVVFSMNRKTMVL